MADLIDREAAIEAITNYAKFLWDNYHETCNLAGMIDAIEALPAAEPRWIPVTESLPEDNEYVLVTTAEGGVTDAKYWHRERIWVKGLAIVNVTAWMSLPNPWRGEEDETD